MATCLFWNPRIAVSVQHHNVMTTLKILLKDSIVSMVSPPSAQLPVKATIQSLNQMRIFITDKGIKVLITEMTSESVLGCHVVDGFVGYNSGELSWFPLALQVDEHHSRVVTLKTVWMRLIRHRSVGLIVVTKRRIMLGFIHVQDVTIHWRQLRCETKQGVRLETKIKNELHLERQFSIQQRATRNISHTRLSQ